MRASRLFHLRGPHGGRGCPGLPALLAWALALPAGAADTTPPVLVTYAYSPPSFSVSLNDTTLTGTIQATDDSSGLASAYIAFYSPSSNRRVDCHSNNGGYSGTLLAGTFTCAGVFPRYTETGQWNVQLLAIADKAGNVATYTKQQLAALGFNTALTLTGQSDLTPPALASYIFSPATVLLGAAPVQAAGTINATDDLSGLYHAYLAFYSPSGNQRVDCYATPGGPTGGSPLSGFFSCSGVFLPGLETGIWTVKFAEVSDKAGNTRVYPTAELASMSLPVTLAVSSVSDPAPPDLVNLTLNPLSINTLNGPAGIAGVLTATDSGSGIRQGVVALFSPSGQQRVDCATAVQEAGLLNGAIPCSGSFPQNSDSGAWAVRFVTLTDQAGNTRTVDSAALAALGVPAAVSVTGAPPPAQNFGMSFQAVAGGAAPPGQQFQILGSDRPWILQAENSSPWLAVSPSNGNAPKLVTVSVNPANLAPGVYHDTILIQEVVNNLPPARLPVTLTVLAAAPLTAAYFETPLFDSILAGDALAGETVTAFVYIYWPALP